MRAKSLVAALATVLMLLGLAVPASADDVTSAPVTLAASLDAQGASTDAAHTPDWGWTTYAVNISTSDRNVQVARYRNGEGTRQSLRPGQWSYHDTDSVWIGYIYSETGCRTYLNGTLYPYHEWVNTAWWRKIEIEVRC